MKGAKMKGGKEDEKGEKEDEKKKGGKVDGKDGKRKGRRRACTGWCREEGTVRNYLACGYFVVVCCCICCTRCCNRCCNCCTGWCHIEKREDRRRRKGKSASRRRKGVSRGRRTSRRGIGR